MRTLNYDERDVEKVARAAIANRDSFEFVVRGPKAKLIEDAIPIWNEAFSRDVRFTRRIGLGVKLCGLVRRTPHFWPLYFQARRTHMRIGVIEGENSVVISFEPD